MRESNAKRSKSEQKRSTPLYRLEFAPIKLSPEFPLSGGGRYQQPDAPITRLHLHDCLEFGYCHAGAGIFVVEGKVMPFVAGDATVITDRETHLARSADGTTSEWTFLSLDPAGLLGGRTETPDALDLSRLSGPEFRNVISGREHPDIAEPVRELAREMAEKRTGYRDAARGLTLTILARLARIAPLRRTRSSSKRRPALERIAPALAFLAARFAETITVEELAAHCHVSPPQLRRLFLAAVGRPPHRYLSDLRVQMAATLLRRTNRAVLDIAQASGFPTLSAFNRQFRQILGQTPREWRRADSTPGD